MDKVYTPQEVAELLSISDKTMMDWLRAGKIQGVKVGKYWRIMEQDLEAFLQQNRVEPPAEELGKKGDQSHGKQSRSRKKTKRD